MTTLTYDRPEATGLTFYRDEQQHSEVEAFALPYCSKTVRLLQPMFFTHFSSPSQRSQRQR
ncbi:MAG: hypothetical protein RBJ76_11285 [Stenomitos frigidus ULC029]